MTARCRILPWVVALALPLWWVDASAQSLRCRNDLANVGDTKSAVASKCGQPIATDSYCKVQTNLVVPGTTPQPSINTPCDNVDVWTYRPGSGQLVTTLKFESGRLRSIEYGDRIP